jgi:hypothetical protein
MLSPRMVPEHTYLTRSTHSNLSRSHQQIWTDPLLLRRRAPNPTHSTPTDRSVGSYLASLPEQPKKQWGKVKLLLTKLLGLPSPYHRHDIGTFNTCSQVPTHRSLIDKGGGYNHLRAPPDLRLFNPNTASRVSDVKHLSLTCGLSTTRHLSKSISMPSNF